MSLYDDTDPQHLLYLEQHRARWEHLKARRALAEAYATIARVTDVPMVFDAMGDPQPLAWLKTFAKVREGRARASHVLEIAHG